MPNNIIRAEELFKSYNIDGVKVDVLKAVNVAIDVGDTIAVVGSSGAGKSTFLHQLGLLEKPSSGRVLFEGREASSMNDDERADLRLTKIGFVFQFHHLLSELTALENVMLPGLILRRNMSWCRERAGSLLKDVGLENRLEHKPGELSGGEQQRVALARALVNKPVLILADEPTGNLDKKSSIKLQELLWGLCADKSAALMVVTHNENLARGADRIIEMSDGRLMSVTSNT